MSMSDLPLASGGSDAVRRAGEAEELHRMQLSAISVLALMNTRESAALHRIDNSNPCWTPSLQDVYDAVDREMTERERAEAASSRAAELRDDIFAERARAKIAERALAETEEERLAASSRAADLERKLETEEGAHKVTAADALDRLSALHAELAEERARADELERNFQQAETSRATNAQLLDDALARLRESDSLAASLREELATAKKSGWRLVETFPENSCAATMGMWFYTMDDKMRIWAHPPLPVLDAARGPDRG